MTLVRALLRSPVVAALTSPHGVDRYLELVNPMWAVNEIRARVVRVEPETHAGAPVATLTLQPTGSWPGHLAGQYVQLGVEIDGVRHLRCFSVSSPASGRGGRITITVRANPDGVVSSYLVGRARPGLVVHLSRAAGAFTVPEPPPRQLLFISGGSGITPVMSMVRTLLRRGYGGTITFLHYSRSPAHQIFAGELAALPPNVHVHLVHPRQDGRRLTPAELSRLVPGYRDVDTWACGPAGLIERIQDAYAGSDRLRVEYFRPPAARGPASGEVIFTRAGATVATVPNSGATLLEQAEAAGLAPTFGCRMGICLSCMSHKTEGVVRNVRTGEESRQPDEDIRICVSAPVGTCAVEIPAPSR
ncbi:MULTISPECIES: ferredoxin reductase [Protofrankia]|uniref:Oxidoreductase FAD-binding domain protein n=1 Tax=Candidatus Protofrankia datiscae TaxID=2716812 RepID=F8AWL1_9ACTN|nr:MULTISPECIES: ferredoxin reductase [Protofrankia]AEH09348.1 Oxidoreductase FAD-binding domain protein [Candidatus Protofrankia datiscae]